MFAQGYRAVRVLPDTYTVVVVVFDVLKTFAIKGTHHHTVCVGLIPDSRVQLCVWLSLFLTLCKSLERVASSLCFIRWIKAASLAVSWGCCNKKPILLSLFLLGQHFVSLHKYVHKIPRFLGNCIDFSWYSCNWTSKYGEYSLVMSDTFVNTSRYN